jgi:hypothetical protein
MDARTLTQLKPLKASSSKSPRDGTVRQFAVPLCRLVKDGGRKETAEPPGFRVTGIDGAAVCVRRSGGTRSQRSVDRTSCADVRKSRWWIVRFASRGDRAVPESREPRRWMSWHPGSRNFVPPAGMPRRARRSAPGFRADPGRCEPPCDPDETGTEWDRRRDFSATRDERERCRRWRVTVDDGRVHRLWLSGSNNARRGCQAGRHWRPRRRSKPLKGKAQGRYRCETKPGGPRKERDARRLRKPVGVAQPGEANPVWVAFRSLMRRRATKPYEGMLPVSGPRRVIL